MSSARLLWVDDEIDLLKAHLLFLTHKGYEVRAASNGADALDLCRAERFDLVLLDENMPGLSGLETLAQIKRIAPDLPVVMVTKNEAEDLMDQAIGAQIADYLIKPVSPSQVLLALKKNIHRRELVQERAQIDYREDFARIGAQLSSDLTATGWMDLYRSLVRWELLSSLDGAMGEMLLMQKQEANAAFAKYVQSHYADWLTSDAGSRPLLSPDVFNRTVLPSLRGGRRTFLLVIDNLRYDQWRTIAPELAEDFDLDEQLYFSILPTATQYARNALFAGLMPADIRSRYPDLWVDEEEDEGKNLNEETLIRHQLERRRCKATLSYHKLNDSGAVDRLLSSFATSLNADLNVVVINFIDILSHARTESRMVRELAGGEAAYRSITRSWFRHTAVKELFRRIAALDCDVVLTTDHGSIRVSTPIKIVGDRNVNTNLRYKLGRNLSYPAKEVFEVRTPQRYGLPAPNLSTAYVFARGDRFFAYPNNYNHYVQYYRDTFQHGGISMEEMLVPLISMRPKQR